MSVEILRSGSSIVAKFKPRSGESVMPPCNIQDFTHHSPVSEMHIKEEDIVFDPHTSRMTFVASLLLGDDSRHHVYGSFINYGPGWLGEKSKDPPRFDPISQTLFDEIVNNHPTLLMGLQKVMASASTMV